MAGELRGNCWGYTSGKCSLEALWYTTTLCPELDLRVCRFRGTRFKHLFQLHNFGLLSGHHVQVSFYPPPPILTPTHAHLAARFAGLWLFISKVRRSLRRSSRTSSPSGSVGVLEFHFLSRGQGTLSRCHGVVVKGWASRFFFERDLRIRAERLTSGNQTPGNGALRPWRAE